jgi:hypothetical protein
MDDTARKDQMNDRNRKMAKGWGPLATWKDGASSWVSPKEFKESGPVQVVEHAVAARIHEEPAFTWWVPHVVKKRERVVEKMKSPHWHSNRKFGFESPRNVARALAIDKIAGTTRWRDAIRTRAVKEMRKVKPAFELAESDHEAAKHGNALPGFHEIRCHIVRMMSHK